MWKLVRLHPIELLTFFAFRSYYRVPVTLLFKRLPGYLAAKTTQQIMHANVKPNALSSVRPKDAQDFSFLGVKECTSDRALIESQQKVLQDQACQQKRL